MNRHIKFNWNCHFRRPKEIDHLYKLSESGFEGLLSYIKENNLNRNLKEIRKADNLGFGMYKDWTKRGKKKECNIKNIEYYNAISFIISQAENKNDSFPIKSLF